VVFLALLEKLRKEVVNGKRASLHESKHLALDCPLLHKTIGKGKQHRGVEVWPLDQEGGIISGITSPTRRLSY